MHGEYAEMIRTHFMHLVKPQEHKFAALHGAVWSGGSFVYVPKGVSVTIPLQSYFRLNAPGAGQFEHTLIIVDEGAYLHFIEGCSAPKYNVANLHAGCVELYVGKNAKLRYSTIENWSKNMYNLNTKRAIVEEGGTIEWVSGSFGSHVSYLYPMSILKGDDSRMEFTGITFAGEGQNLDTGAKVVHTGKRTSSYVNTKSISKDGGISTFRSSVQIGKQASGSKASVSCQSLMLDDISRSDTVPAMDIRTRDANVGHEAKIGRISDEAVFYLMSRGISEEDARAMIVSGFADDVSKELPVFVVCIGLEAASMALTSIWFAGGALIACVLSIAGVNLYIQMAVFVVVSFLLLYSTRPLALRYINQKTVRTNVDALVGKKARVTAEIDNDEARGTAMVSGQEWTARSADGSRIPKDTMVQIQAVSGVKLIVSKCKEE